MSQQDWTCPVCHQPNCSADTQCVNCGCPSNASDADIAELNRQYKGPRFAGLPDASPVERSTSEVLSEKWWNEKSTTFEAAILMFLIYATGTFIALVIRSLSTGDVQQPVAYVFSPLFMGVAFTIRSWLTPSDALRAGTRKHLLIAHAAICAIGLGIASVVAARTA